jgi:hypothetical protein
MSSGTRSSTKVGNAIARAATTGAMKHLTLVLALAAVAGCTDDDLDTDSLDQEATTVPALTNATTTFTTAVGNAVRDASAARGVTLTSAISTSYSPYNTIGTAAAGDSAVLLVERSFMGGLRSAGLYQIKPSSTGANLYRFDPGGLVLVGSLPPPQARPFPWHCESVPLILRPYCTELAACATQNPSWPPCP